MITRVSDPAFDTLTPTELSDWVRIDTGSDPTTTAILLASAADYIEGQTGVALAVTSYELHESNFCDSVLPIYIAPIQSIDKVVIVQNGVVSVTTDFNVVLTGDPAIIFPTVIACDFIYVSLTAGYPSLDQVPLPLRHAVAVMVSAGYNNREAIDPATFTTVGNLIARYRRVAI